MITRRNGLKLGAAGIFAAVGLGSRRSAATEVIKVGTLAPKSSPWGKVFETWIKAVNEKTGGALELQFFYNGAQGDETGMVAKIKSGQLDGAAISGIGLGKVYLPILALQMPGLFTSWNVLNRARDAMNLEFVKGARDAGFTVLGWGDVGRVCLMSKGFAVRVPQDLAGKRPLALRDDPIQSSVFQEIGGIAAVPASVPEVLPFLNTGAINFLAAPALVAEQLQWAPKVDTITDFVTGVTIGGLVFSSRRIDALPGESRQVLIDTGKVAATALTTRIRTEDDAAMLRLKATKTVVQLTLDEKNLWAAVFERTRRRMAQGLFPAEVVERLERFGRP